MAAPSPLSQSHPPPTSHDGDEGSEGSDVEDDQPVQQVTSALRQLSMVQEVDVDLSELHALSPEVISKQATINIGTFFLISLSFFSLAS